MRNVDLKSMASLSDFAFFYNFYGALDNLENLAMTESWKYSHPDGRANIQNPILENYFHHTFKRLLYEYNSADLAKKQSIIYFDDTLACFNTGLFTKTYNMIYAVFRTAHSQQDRKPYVFCGFEQPSSRLLTGVPELPKRANYFANINELIYDSSLPLRADTEHILQENIARFPPDLIGTPMLTALFTGAIELAKKRVQANYRAAVPTFYRDEICLMLPLCLTDPQKTDLALAIKRYDGFYTAKTCLTLDMAYNDARLIAKPDVDWLIP